MIDDTRLAAPANDGGVLVAPEPRHWLEMARSNQQALNTCDARFLDSTLAEWRRKTRERLVDSDDRLVFAFGHQPGFFHSGVWAKHVVGMRAARACGGVALNLVVDNDAPRQAGLVVPVVKDHRPTLQHVMLAAVKTGLAYEEFPKLTSAEIDRCEREVQEAMGERYGRSQMPRFFDALSATAGEADFTDQMIAARTAVEANFEVSVTDLRVSRAWFSPFLADLLLNAERFAAGYNAALNAYRRQQKVRGAQQPIPDLLVEPDRCELPVWAYRPGEVRRRLFVDTERDVVRLSADRAPVGEITRDALLSPEDIFSSMNKLNDRPLTNRGRFASKHGEAARFVKGWRLRPRALTLTIWARLLLSDLFIHGIGGAKYDRISDAVIRDYYGIEPPRIACVSATLRLDLPAHDVTPEQVRRMRHLLRDLHCNPQRHVPSDDADIEPILRQREEAVGHSERLKRESPDDRRSRGKAFREIRRLNERIRSERPELTERQSQLAAQIAEAEQALRENAIALGREYFFGLYGRPQLQRLLAALPTEKDFAV